MNALRVGLALLLACPPAAAQELGKLADHLENTGEYSPPEEFPPELAGRVATRSGALSEVYDELAAEQPCEEPVEAEELQPGEYHSRRLRLLELEPGCERAKVLASLAAFNREEKTPLIQAGLSNVQGRCVAYCGGAPSGGSSGGGSYEMGSALGQLMGKAIVGLFSALGQAMADAGKARRERAPRASPSRSSWRSEPARVEAPKPPPKKPLKATGLSLSAPTSVEEGAEIVLRATLSFEGEEGSKAGIPVTLKVDHKDRLLLPRDMTARTGADGTATFVVRAKPDATAQGQERARDSSDRAQDALDREARKLGFESSGPGEAGSEEVSLEASAPKPSPEAKTRFTFRADVSASAGKDGRAIAVLAAEVSRKPSYRLVAKAEPERVEASGMVRLAAQLSADDKSAPLGGFEVIFELKSADGKTQRLHGVTDAGGLAHVDLQGAPKAAPVVAGRRIGEGDDLTEASMQNAPFCAAFGVWGAMTLTMWAIVPTGGGSAVLAPIAAPPTAVFIAAECVLILDSAQIIGQAFARGNDPTSMPGSDPRGRLRDPVFRRWFHRVWKKGNIPGNRDATPDELEQAWNDWNNEGRPDAD